MLAYLYSKLTMKNSEPNKYAYRPSTGPGLLEELNL